MQPQMLYYLNLFKVLPANEEYSGLYIIESRYGQRILTKISLDLSFSSEKKALLIYKYLTNEEKNSLINIDPTVPVYILANKMLNYEYLKDLLEKMPQASVIGDYSDSTNLRNINELKSSFNKHLFFRAKFINNELNNKKTKSSIIFLPVFLILVTKFIFNPLSEAKRIYLILQYSNSRILIRTIELTLFLQFLFKILFYPIGYKFKNFLIYNVSHFIKQIGRVIYYGVGYKLRHLVLLLFRFIYYQVIYRIIHFLNQIKNIIVYKILYFIYYDVLHRVCNFLIYNIVYFIYYNIVKQAFYKTRHMVLMICFKSFGVAYDFLMLLHRFIKLYLMYPFYKIYWFCNFQYNKRVKKYFKNDET